LLICAVVVKCVGLSDARHRENWDEKIGGFHGASLKFRKNLIP
jgi:hypothetical protein